MFITLAFLNSACGVGPTKSDEGSGLGEAPSLVEPEEFFVSLLGAGNTSAILDDHAHVDVYQIFPLKEEPNALYPMRPTCFSTAEPTNRPMASLATND